MSLRLGDVVPISRIKLVDVERLVARFGRRAEPVPQAPDELRRSSSDRVARLLADPSEGFDKLTPHPTPGRGLTGRLRLFRAFKLLGDLKQPPPALDLLARAVADRLDRARDVLHL